MYSAVYFGQPGILLRQDMDEVLASEVIPQNTDVTSETLLCWLSKHAQEMERFKVFEGAYVFVLSDVDAVSEESEFCHSLCCFVSAGTSEINFILDCFSEFVCGYGKLCKDTASVYGIPDDILNREFNVGADETADPLVKTEIERRLDNLEKHLNWSEKNCIEYRLMLVKEATESSA